MKFQKTGNNTFIKEEVLLMKNQKKKSSWVLVSILAILSGIFSFLVTINLYDSERIAKEQIAMHEKETLPMPISVYEEKPLTVIAKEEVTSESILKETTKTSKTDETVVDAKNKNQENSNFENEVRKDYQEEKVVEVANMNRDTAVIIQPNTPLFIWPVSGELGIEYAPKELVYSQTLKEWITHAGIDIIGKEAEPVKAIADGIIESVKLDPRYGNTIIMNHENGYRSIYANLSTTDLVYVGKKIKQGEIISGVGKGFGYESSEPPHIHFELIFEENNVSPFIITQ